MVKRFKMFGRSLIVFTALLGLTALALGAIGPNNVQAASRVENCQSQGSADAIDRCMQRLNEEAWAACINRPPADRGRCADEYRNDDLGSNVETGSGELDKWLSDIINLLSAAVGVVIVFSLIFAGIQYMTAGGNASQVAAAKNRIAMAILALILFLFTYAILQWLIPGGIF